MTPEYESRFSGIGRLYGIAGMKAFEKAHIAIIGIGGVGTWVAEGLARAGIGEITLVDLDEICVSNTNRQLHTLENTIGLSKVAVMADRLRLISPDLKVNAINDFFSKASADSILTKAFDLIVDAIDSIPAKALLISKAKSLNIPIVVCGGAGGRKRPDLVRFGDLNQCGADGLLKQLKKSLKTQYGFEKGQEPWGITAVFSSEKAIYPTADGGVCDMPQSQSLRLDCQAGFGAISMVTGTFGFMLAYLSLELICAQANINR
jgi:tRNA A37 threonylcarbamoyladenosine dehydratase